MPHKGSKVPPQTLPKPSDTGHKSHVQHTNGASSAQTMQGGVTSPGGGVSTNGPVQMRPNSASDISRTSGDKNRKGIPPAPTKAK